MTKKHSVDSIKVFCSDTAMKDHLGGAIKRFLPDLNWQYEDSEHSSDLVVNAPLRLSQFLDRIKYTAEQKNSPQKLNLGIYILNVPQNELTQTSDGSVIKLTDKEKEILLYLARSERPVPRDELLKAVWGYADSAETHTSDTHIYRLRQKIERDASNPEFLLMGESGYYLKV